MPIANAGRSAIHSALSFWQVEHVWVTEKLLAGRVESVSASVYELPVRAIEAAILSPGRMELPTVTVPAGYISYQVKYVALSSKHQLSVPSCSTVPLL